MAANKPGKEAILAAFFDEGNYSPLFTDGAVSAAFGCANGQSVYAVYQNGEPVGAADLDKTTRVLKMAAETGNPVVTFYNSTGAKLEGGLELLDTPGILWPKFEDQTVGLRLAFIGSIKDELSNQYELCLLLMKYLQEHYPEAVPKAYQIEADDSEVVLLERVAKRRGCLKAGGEYDLDKAANYVIDDFRNGRLGAISLEQPEK